MRRCASSSSALSFAVSPACSRRACCASASAARRAARSSRTRVVSSSARRAAASARRASASLSASCCSSAPIRCSACSARRCAAPRRLHRVLALGVEGLGALAQRGQLVHPRLGDLARLVGRGQPRLGRPGRAQGALGLLAGGGDLALALGQRALRRVRDVDRLARLVGGPCGPLAVLARVLLLGRRPLAGPDAFLGERVDGGGAGGLGARRDLRGARGLRRGPPRDGVRLGRAALRVLARGALLGQPPLQRRDVAARVRLADVRGWRRLLGRPGAGAAQRAGGALALGGRRRRRLRGCGQLGDGLQAPAAARGPGQVDDVPAPALQGVGDARRRDDVGRRAERRAPHEALGPGHRRRVLGPGQRREPVDPAPVVEQQQRRGQPLARRCDPAASDPQQHRAGTSGDLLEGLNLEARSHEGREANPASCRL